MRNIDDLEHFVLAEGETLILRLTRHCTDEHLRVMRDVIERTLPGRPVLVLSPDIEVRAGKIEVFGVDMGADEKSTPSQEGIDAERKRTEFAYEDGRTVWVQGIVPSDRELFCVHVSANPHTFDWDKYNYSLTKPK